MYGEVDKGRRRLLLGQRTEYAGVVRPPGATEKAVRALCTGCGDCAASCPQEIIRIHDGLPLVDFSVDECTFCGSCADACQTDVFAGAARPPFEHRVQFGQGCFARSGIICQSCGDACPETAIRFRPRLGQPPLPEVVSSRCNGCGACIAACPADVVKPDFEQMEKSHA